MSDLIHRLIDSDDNCFVGDYYDPTHRTDEIYTCLDCLDAGIRAAEQERIIKLLEEAKPLQETDELEWGIDVAIALIKGENK